MTAWVNGAILEFPPLRRDTGETPSQPRTTQIAFWEATPARLSPNPLFNWEPQAIRDAFVDKIREDFRAILSYN